MKKINVVVFLLCLTVLSCKKEISYDYQVIQVEGLFSLTGNLSYMGIASREALNLAISDINNRMEQSALPYRFSSIIYDTKQNAASAVEGMQLANGKDIRFILGPGSSSELEAIYSYANAKEMLVVSNGSSASFVGYPGDAVFRVCPDDQAQGLATARAMYKAGKSSIITVCSDEPGTISLRTSTANKFTELGGVVEELPAYLRNTTNFSQTVIALKTAIENQSSVLGPGYVAVFLAAFDEVKELMRQSDAYPSLSSVQWYGNDGVIKASIISDPIASRFAAEAQFIAVGFGVSPGNPDLSRITESIVAATGVQPDAYSLSVYDAMWLIANTVVDLKGDLSDFKKMKEVFQSEASRYTGITGPMTLNASGDRASSVFDFWKIVREGGNYKWIKLNDFNGI